MTQAARCALTLLAVSLLVPSTRAGDPVARLPEGAQVVAFFDLAAWRASSAMKALDAESLGQEFGLAESLFEGLGEEGSLDRFAIGGFPTSAGQDMQLALIVDGTWDQGRMTKSLLESGAVEVAVGGQSAYRMPKDENGDDFVLSFLEDGRLALSDWDLAERVRAGGGPLSKALSNEVAALPAELSAWLLVADPLEAGAKSGVDAGPAAGLASGIRSMALWARAAGELEVGASALTGDSQEATQLGAFVQLALLGISSQGGGEWSDVLSTLRFDTKGERLSLALKLGPEQVARVASEFSGLTMDASGR